MPTSSRKKDTVVQDTGNYWLNYLRANNLIGLVEPQEHPSATRGEEEALTQDQRIFILRLSEGLHPIKQFEAPAQIKFLLSQREQRRKELTDIFYGRRNFNEWFNDTAVREGTQNEDFFRIIINSAEGLPSREMINLREQYLAALEKSKSPI